MGALPETAPQVLPSHTFAQQHDFPLVPFGRDQRKDHVAASYGAEFEATRASSFLASIDVDNATAKATPTANAWLAPANGCRPFAPA
jgi:hypothetical protein